MSDKIGKSSFILAPSMKMPVVGLGTWQATDEEIETAIDAALEAGYRHIDTAYVYMNEAAIGRALAKWLDSGRIKREELFITTKLPNVAMRPELIATFLGESLAALRLEFVDLYLLHHPVGLVAGEGLLPRGADGLVKVDPTTDHEAIWQAMEKEVDAGRVKAIGVSNFNTRQIDRLLKVARIPPSNNQVEMHLYLQQREMLAWSARTGVTLCAYAPIGSPALTRFIEKVGGSTEGVRELDPLTEPAVLRIAQRHGKTAAQVLLRHLLQLGVAVIPKSVSPARVRQNIQVFDFELSAEEIAELNALDKGEDGRRFVGGILKGVEKHPEYPFA